MPSPTAPIVNGNGTSRQALTDERMVAIRALRAAEDALVGVTVNGRDYIGDPSRFTAAVNAHTARLTAIRNAINDLTAEVISLMRSNDGR